MARKSKKRHGHSRLRRRYGRSAVPMKVHGQLFIEPETVAEAVQEAVAEIAEAEVPAAIAAELTPTLISEAIEEAVPAALRSEELTQLGYSRSRRR